jgi:hypothetical protein
MYSGFKLADLLTYEALSLETTSVSSEKQWTSSVHTFAIVAYLCGEQ